MTSEQGPATKDARQRLVEALVATGEEDRAAFASVYRLTSSKLFGICLRICGTRQAAEDVLQDVYVTIWKRAGGYDPGRSSPITWLATIARNRAIDWRRSRGNAAPEVSPDGMAEIVDPTASASDVMLLDEADRQLHRCLDTLDGDQREAIRTAFFDGLTYAELATRADVPLGTMKSRVRRGLARLRECLGDE
ncbi:sigma-70 family RNA polymerase sigma factor [Sphingomonas bacterium]|uniref:sigma-70 family RNA polymerase sigma factor n=1 Tax=Sphingomonas bacterium TaxID=1895847 RepID=UPI001576CF3E|nr:sigma-70 family RNA polymerase sigma factor [Sphingomonas bacterium]